MTAKSSTNCRWPPVNKPLKVAVLAGGIGSERDISLQSGQCIVSALKGAGVNVVLADIGPDNPVILEDGSIDVFFLALHGEFGEDGRLQQLLEDRALCYTGSGPTACRLAFDKLAGKKLFAAAGVKTPKSIRFSSLTQEAEIKRQLPGIGDKFVVKPVRQGSTIGVIIAEGAKQAVAAGRDCLEKFGDCMIEEYIAGREVTVGILDDKALPVIEIKTKNGFYDYNAKYLDRQTQYLFDTIGPAPAAAIAADAVNCFNCLGLRHFARVDFILGNDNTPYALEANAIPGMTAHSLLPKAAEKAGISMGDLCMKIIESALKNKKADIVH